MGTDNKTMPYVWDDVLYQKALSTRYPSITSCKTTHLLRHVPNLRGAIVGALQGYSGRRPMPIVNKHS